MRVRIDDGRGGAAPRPRGHLDHELGRLGDGSRRRHAARTFQMASRMKGLVGESGEAADDERALAYLAKFTINAALAHGLAHLVGSLEVGKLADVVLWKPAFFPVKPEMVVKSGFAAWGAAGSGSASVERAEPVAMVPRERRWHGRPEPVRRTRGVRKRDMVRNDRLPTVRVDPESLGGQRRRQARRCRTGPQRAPQPPVPAGVTPWGDVTPSGVSPVRLTR